MSEQITFPSFCLHDLATPLPFSDSIKSTLTESDIALCFGNLNEIDFSGKSSLNLISEQQRREANHIKNSERRNHFIGIRACLNTFLSHFTGIDPAEHEFIRNSSGKPSLKSPYQVFHFNLSHSENYFLMAVSLQPVGVDLEKKNRKIPELKDIISRYYSSEEQETVRNSAYPEESFLKIWTMKESVIKLFGTGIHENIKEINTRNLSGNQQLNKEMLHIYSGSINDFFISICTSSPETNLHFQSTGVLF